MLGPKALEDIFVYRVLEQRYGHNPQLRVGWIHPHDKYCHKINRNNNQKQKTLRSALSRNVPMYSNRLVFFSF
jgi:hypothetical protein